MAEHRVVVVGAGIGGLVSALLLASRGLGEACGVRGFRAGEHDTVIALGLAWWQIAGLHAQWTGGNL